MVVNAFTFIVWNRLLPTGITSEARFRYKDEAYFLDVADDVDKVNVEQILPVKMKYNLDSIRQFSFFGEILTMFKTVFVVLGKEYEWGVGSQ